MAAPTDKELENQLVEAGKKLLNPPSTVDELLNLLDQIETSLSRVEQSPCVSMQNALCDSIKALVAENLLRHSDTDVKVAVASCISEITRITAPEAPYNDNQMKEIFQLIVVAFEKLFDTSSRSYDKRVSILETVAKVRSCVVMLDLECDALILEMFQHFLKAIRDNHPDNILSSMETIMTLVLEESEEIPSELLFPLLTTVKKDNQDVLPIAKSLAEKVLQNSAAKLKPYLMQAMESFGTSMHDYSKVVASICRETFDNIEPNVGSLSEEHLADQQKMPEQVGSDDAPQADKKNVPENVDCDEAIVSDDAPQVADEMNPEVASSGVVDSVVEKSQKSVTSNAPAQTEISESLIGLDSVEKKDCSDSFTPLTKDEPNINPEIVNTETNEPNINSEIVNSETNGPNINSEIVNSETNGPNINSEIVSSETKEPNVNSELVNSETKEDDIGKKTEDQKPISSLHSVEASYNSRMVTDKEAGEHAEESKSRSEEDNNSPSQDLAVIEATVPSEKEKETPTQQTSLTESHDETVKASLASPSRSLPGTRSKKGRRQKKKRNSNQDSGPGLSSGTKGAFSNDPTPTEDEPPPSADVISKTEIKTNKDSEEKQNAHSGGKEKANEVETSHPVDDNPMKESDLARETEGKPLKRSGKKVKANEDKTPQPVDDASMKESDPASETEEKPLRRSGKRAVEKTSKEDELSLEKQEVITKKGKRENKSKDVTGEPSSMDKVSSPRTSKSSNKDKSHLEETPNTKSKRKRTSGKEMVSKTPNSGNDHDEDLVGSKIKVWWPHDKMFYEGTVDSFDSVKKKHKVSYVDGDVEILNLRKERWEYVEEDTGAEREEATGLPSSDSSEMPRKKKVKADLGSSTLQTKRNSSAKRSGGSSTSRSDRRSKNSAGKSKDSSDKSMDEPPKSGGKRKRGEVQNRSSKAKDDETSTEPEERDAKSNDKKDDKSKDGTPKTSSKVKDVHQKRGGKVKVEEDDTPKTSSTKPKRGGTPNTNTSNKSTANGDTSAAKKGKSGSSSKVQESKDSSSKGKSAKAEEIETDKSQKKAEESETKSGRKRPRKARRS